MGYRGHGDRRQFPGKESMELGQSLGTSMAGASLGSPAWWGVMRVGVGLPHLRGPHTEEQSQVALPESSSISGGKQMTAGL